MPDLLDIVMQHPLMPRGAALTLERIARAGKSVRVQRERSHRRELSGSIPQQRALEQVFDPVRGFGWLPKGTVRGVPAAVEFAQNVLRERRHMERPKNKHGKIKETYLVDLLDPSRYEDAPPLFDLALSDEILQIASEYLGEIPILLRVNVFWSPVNTSVKGSQLYHRDGGRRLTRRAKFIFAASDVDEGSGPFTFIPADVSERVARKVHTRKDRVEDDEIYRYVDRKDELTFVGPAGSGLVIDSGRCFHFGSRSQADERLVIMFQYWCPIDLPLSQSLKIKRSPALLNMFGDDPARMLVIPDAREGMR